MSETIPQVTAYTLRAVSITDRGWISQTATTMEDDSPAALSLARAENLLNLHRIIGTEPAGFALRIPTTWVEPSDDMLVRIHETLIHHDMMTGKHIKDIDLDEYEIKYSRMGV